MVERLYSFLLWPEMPIYSGVIQAAIVLGSAIFQINKKLPEKTRRIQKNLSESQVLLEPGQETLPDFLAEHKVHVIASLPSSLDLKWWFEGIEKKRFLNREVLVFLWRCVQLLFFPFKNCDLFVLSDCSIQKKSDIFTKENMCFFHVFFYMTFWSIFRYFSNETNTCFPPSSKIQHPHIRLGYEAEQTDKCHGEESFTWSAKQPFFKGTEVW